MMKTLIFIISNKVRICTRSSNLQHLKHSLHISSCGITVVPFRFIGSTVEKDFPKKKLDLDFPERRVTLFTCASVYEKWRKERSFYRIPQSGVNVEISYIDTLDCLEKTETKPIKTVMCVHGIPGNYGVFSHVIKGLAKEGIRVIVPTFPDSLYFPGKHKKELFHHSVEEKTQVFKDLLKVLNISKLDAVIAHSSAIYPALKLVLDPDLDVKSQVLFNTGGHKPTVTMRPYWVVWATAYMTLNPMGKLFLQKSLKFILKYIMRSPIKDENLDGIALLALTMVFSQFWKADKQFQTVSQKQIPTLYIFSEDDKVVERKLTYEVISLLGASKENITFYDKEAQLIKRGKDLPWLKLISFEEGSHYVFRKYPDICNKEIIELLQKLERLD